MPTRRAVLASAVLALPAPVLAATPSRAQEATPTAAPVELLAEVAIPGVVFPAGPVSAMAARHAFAPGTTGGDLAREVLALSAQVLVVLAGVLAITGEVTAVQRAAGTPAAMSPAADEMRLGPGDAAAFALDPDRAVPSQSLRNAGDEPLVFVEAWLVGIRTSEIPPVFAVGSAEFDYQSYPAVELLPSAATATLRVTRTTVAPGERRGPADGGWQIALANSEDLARSPTDGTVTNLTDDPMEVVVVTAAFTPVAATPTA